MAQARIQFTTLADPNTSQFATLETGDQGAVEHIVEMLKTGQPIAYRDGNDMVIVPATAIHTITLA